MTHKLNEKHIEDLRSGKIALDNSGNPNVELLRQVLTEAFPKDIVSTTTNGRYKYYFYSSKKYTYNLSDTNIHNLPTVSLLYFISKQEEFPKDDLSIIVENNNGKEIIDYLISKGFRNSESLRGGMFDGHYSIRFNTNYITSNPINSSKTYTLEQLKQLGNNNMKATREIIGYECIKSYPGVDLGTKNVGKTSYEHYWYIKYADYWKPIYKSSEVTINVNNVNVTIGQNMMKAESKAFDIKWLRAIRELFNGRSHENCSWSSKVESITIGCKTGWKVEHLDEIIKKYEEINK